MTSRTAPIIATNGTSWSISRGSSHDGRHATAQNTATAPRAASTMPAIGVRTRAGGETFWPRITPTMSSRPSPRDGINAAMTADAIAQPTMIVTGTTGTSNGPKKVSGR